MGAIFSADCVPMAECEESLVSIVEVESLEPPEVGPPGWYKLPPARPLDPDDESSTLVVPICLRVGMDRPTAINVDLVNHEIGSKSRFEFVRPPIERTTCVDPLTVSGFHNRVKAVLRTGRGAFWTAEERPVTESARFRCHLLIPNQLVGPFMRLELTAAEKYGSPDPCPAAVELVREFLYGAVIGDSVQWGNGLPDSDKSSSLVFDLVERETGRKAVVQRYAQAGATITPTPEDEFCVDGCTGEAPQGRTSVMTQVDLLERPELLEIVLLDGCINDVGVSRILNPLGSQARLLRRTEQACGSDMVGLLKKVRATAPAARVIVTSYYPIVSHDSDLFGLQAWSAARTPNEVNLGRLPYDALLIAGTTAILAERSMLFHEASEAALSGAVDTVNEESGGSPMVALASAGFQPQNSAFASESWLWSLTDEPNTITGARALACADPDVVVGLVNCIFASVGHPNADGARAFANAIIHALRRLGVLGPEPED